MTTTAIGGPRARAGTVDLSDPRGRSRLYAATGLVLGPVLSIVASLIDPAYSTGPDVDAAYLDQVASAPALHQAAGVINVVAALLTIVGLIAVIRLLRGPQGALGRIGAGLLVIAVVVLQAGAFTGSVIDAAAVAPGSNRAAALALLTAADSSGFAVVLAIAFFGGFLLGSLLLAVGLVRARPVPVWVAVLVVLQAVVSFVASNGVVDALADALLAVALGAIAWRILALSDEQWGSWQSLPDRAADAEHPAPQS